MKNKSKNSKKTNKSTKAKILRTKTGRVSLKGNKGTVGAPAKPIRFPEGPFTINKVAKYNSAGEFDQCVLSIRGKVDDAVEAGELIRLVARKQKGGKAGRPSPLFIVKAEFDPAVHMKADGKAKTPKKPAQVVAAVETVAPVAAPVVSEPVVVPTTDVTPAAQVSIPVNEVMAQVPTVEPQAQTAPVGDLVTA